jgi:hypothetical protein
MSTPPISHKIAVRETVRRRLVRRFTARAAWLAADVVAIGACAVLALRALA